MKASSALGAKTARACDSCLRIRARWFCAADDAFLCHACDDLVHSANQLASRHERVRLQTASSNKVTTQTWHSGFTRKARTPRHNKHFLVQQQPKNQEKEVLFSNTSTLPLVPELGSEEPLLDYYFSEEHVHCQVPVFDPFDSELCNIYNTMKDNVADEEEAFDLDNFPEFLPSDIDLDVLAVDVESLLGNVHDEDSGHMNGSELFDCKEEDEIDHPNVGVRAKGAMVLKVKDEELEADHAACHHLESVLDMRSNADNWNIDSELLVAAALEEEETVAVPVVASGGADKVRPKERFLRLNYEEVITAWASQGSPWTTENPSNSDDCWPDYLICQELVDRRT